MPPLGPGVEPQAEADGRQRALGDGRKHCVNAFCQSSICINDINDYYVVTIVISGTGNKYNILGFLISLGDGHVVSVDEQAALMGGRHLTHNTDYYNKHLLCVVFYFGDPRSQKQ